MMFVETCDRDGDCNEALTRHLCEDVDIANNAIRFGGDRHRMPRVETKLEDLACNPVFVLDRLIWIGVGPHRDPLRSVFRLGECLPQQICRIRFGE